MGKGNGKAQEAATTQHFSLSVRLGDLVDSVETLNQLVAEKPNGKAPSAAVSMTLAEVVSAVNPHLENYQKVLDQLREKYREPVKDREGKAVEGQYRIPPKNQKAFNEELEALRDMRVQLPIGMIPFSALENEGLGLTAQALSALKWLVQRDVAERLFVAPPPNDADAEDETE